MRSFRVLILATWVILAIGSGFAQAALTVDFTSPGQDWSGSYSLGWAFSVNQPITVTALGFYDDQKNGLTESHSVGIFDADQNLVVSAQVTPGDPLVSWWRWTDATPTVLTPGIEYRIAAVTGSEKYTYNPTGFVSDPTINYLFDADHYDPTTVLTYPEVWSGETGFFGPNFSASPVVPVPGSVLLLVPGLAAIIGLRKRLSVA